MVVYKLVKVKRLYLFYKKRTQGSFLLCDPQHIHIRLSGQFKNRFLDPNLQNSQRRGVKNSAFLTNSLGNSHLQNLRLAGLIQGFPDSSDGKESACNAWDPSSIPGLGRFTGEGIGYTRQYSWASLVAQLVKNLPAMWETWVQPLGWEDPLEKGKATHSSILAWRIPWTV